ncbi:hypothetical protein PR048_028380 [Dryococelus australis]|uniref:Uncharacterized protein n=1 Tax=Dryococelus australis TaxID=614101 RepID=A0ABQ9GJ22_9NEOP|nr:hypothetical protein PR048_028380 [Dryococelus australis]
MSIVVNKLNNLKIVGYLSPDELLKDLCCEDEKETVNCVKLQKLILMTSLQKKKQVMTEKVEVKYTKVGLVTIMKDSVAKYMRHVANRRRQYQALDSAKKEIKENDVLIHWEFSENYNCKYAAKIQSAHFWWLQTSRNTRWCGKFLKRTADRLVVTGTDIPNFNRLTEELEKHSTGMKILVLDPMLIPIVQAKLPKIILPSFKVILMANVLNHNCSDPSTSGQQAIRKLQYADV